MQSNEVDIMILEVFNWIASLLTIWGTIEVSKKDGNLLRTNLLYAFACGILIGIFVLCANWAMVTMYVVLLIIAIRGIKNHVRKT